MSRGASGPLDCEKELFLRLAFQFFPDSPGERAINQIVGVLDELFHQIRRDRAIQYQGIPMTLVHVIAGNNGIVFLAELEGAVRIALQVHTQRIAGRIIDGEKFSADFLDECIRPEGCGFLHMWKGMQKLAKAGSGHRCADKVVNSWLLKPIHRVLDMLVEFSGKLNESINGFYDHRISFAGSVADAEVVGVGERGIKAAGN